MYFLYSSKAPAQIEVQNQMGEGQSIVKLGFLHVYQLPVQKLQRKIKVLQEFKAFSSLSAAYINLL